MNCKVELERIYKLSKKNNKFTRQGVRDLNHIKAKSVGIRLEMPPEPEENKEAAKKQNDTLNNYLLDTLPSKRDFDRY
jgi:hypothetical protein